MKTNFIFIMLFIWTFSFAQQKLKKADRLFDEMAYVEAAKAYEEYLQAGAEPSHQTLGKIADTYYYIRNYKKAEQYYFKILLSTKGLTDMQMSRFIQALRIQKKYSEADRLAESTLTNKSKANRDRFVRQKRYLDSITKLPSEYTINNLPSNSRLADFGAAFYGGKIVYSSAKDTMGTGGRYYKYNEQPFLKLFVAERHPEDGTLFGEREFFPDSQINYHNGTAAFANAETVYFSINNVTGKSRLNNDGKGTNNLQLMRGTIKGDKMKVERLPFNSDAYSVAQPAVSADGNWLFFVSDMPGGYGGTDIYMAPRYYGGGVGEPLNLGPDINTQGDEMFPFATATRLYFSSDGHYGLGGLDIFMSEMQGEALSKPQNLKGSLFGLPQNLGKPFNSNLDDFALILSADGSFGYLSSNREGGKGDDDIYYFTKKEACKQSVSGVVLQKRSKKPLKGAKVTAVGADGDVVASSKTDNDGYYTLILPCHAKVVIEAWEEDYTAEKAEVVTAKEPEQRNVDFELTKYDDLIAKEGETEKVAINPIYFGLDRYDITPQAAAELDKVVYVMKSFPKIIIKIESHTDSRASDEYNITLSQNRANATYDYIISKGIDANRIESVTGYGETRLLNGCSNDVTCSEEEHQLNRRSEFIIVKK